MKTLRVNKENFEKLQKTNEENFFKVFLDIVGDSEGFGLCGLDHIEYSEYEIAVYDRGSNLRDGSFRIKLKDIDIIIDKGIEMCQLSIDADTIDSINNDIDSSMFIRNYLPEELNEEEEKTFKNNESLIISRIKALLPISYSVQGEGYKLTFRSKIMRDNEYKNLIDIVLDSRRIETVLIPAELLYTHPGTPVQDVSIGRYDYEIDGDFAIIGSHDEIIGEEKEFSYSSPSFGVQEGRKKTVLSYDIIMLPYDSKIISQEDPEELKRELT